MTIPDEFGLEAISPNTVFISGKAVTEDDAIDAVQVALKELAKTNDIEKIDQAEDTLLGLQRISGKALASLLHGKKLWWDKSKQEKARQCTFEDYEHTRHGLSSTTIDRYVVVWDKMSSFPKQFQSRPIRELIPVAKAVEQGYAISANDWKALIKATNLAEIGDILRSKVKGTTARRSSRQLKMERDGTINVWIGSKPKFVGYVDVKSEDDDVKKAVARILGGAGVVKR